MENGETTEEYRKNPYGHMKKYQWGKTTDNTYREESEETISLEEKYPQVNGTTERVIGATKKRKDPENEDTRQQDVENYDYYVTVRNGVRGTRTIPVMIGGADRNTTIREVK